MYINAVFLLRWYSFHPLQYGSVRPRFYAIPDYSIFACGTVSGNQPAKSKKGTFLKQVRQNIFNFSSIRKSCCERYSFFKFIV